AWANATPIDRFDALRNALVNGPDAAATAAAATVSQDLLLTVEAFQRLLAIRDGAAPLSPEVLPQAQSILVQAQKSRLFETWRNEERAANVRLGPDEFWATLRDPPEGDWPPPYLGQRPLIDPETVARIDLPGPTAGAGAGVLWGRRRDRLDQ